MHMTRNNALWRAYISCAKIWQYVRGKPVAKGTAMPPLSHHIARDIGLTPSQLDLMRHRWPSQSTRHPYL